jgi:hypothetical protein
MFQCPIDLMMYCLVSRRYRDDHFRGFLVIPFRNTNLIEIKDKFGRIPLHKLSDTLNTLIQERMRNFETLRFLRDTFHFTQPSKISSDKGIHLYVRHWHVIMAFNMCKNISNRHGSVFAAFALIQRSNSSSISASNVG